MSWATRLNMNSNKEIESFRRSVEREAEDLADKIMCKVKDK